MQVGQTAVIVFLSKLAGSVLSFVAMIYFARVLGAEVVGYYVLATSLVAMLAIGGKFGVSTALIKRISEGRDQASYFTAGTLSFGILGAIISIFVLIFDNSVNFYVGADVALFISAILLIKMFLSLVKSALTGEQKVHITGFLSPIEISSQSIIQIFLVVFSFGLTGMLVGYALGGLLSGIIGLWFVSSGINQPTTKHFGRLLDFAKFAWLGSLRSRVHKDADIIILGFFSPASLIGIYGIAWTVANFFTLFGRAISTTLLPEISQADTEGQIESVKQFINNSLAYGGLIVIPGVFGAIILGDRVLRLYGSEFIQGTTVLIILIIATLLYSYQKQLLNAFNGLDRPDLAFRINAIFVVANVTLNLILIYLIGWIGAAIATAGAVFFALLIAFLQLRMLISFTLPYREISMQFFAASVMGLLTYTARLSIELVGLIENNIVIVLGLVSFGSLSYFMTLLLISDRFRSTVKSNSPIEIPSYTNLFN